MGHTVRAQGISVGHKYEELMLCVELLSDYKDPQQTKFGVPWVTHGRRDPGLMTGQKRNEVMATYLLLVIRDPSWRATLPP